MVLDRVLVSQSPVTIHQLRLLSSNQQLAPLRHFPSWFQAQMMMRLIVLYFSKEVADVDDVP